MSVMKGQSRAEHRKLYKELLEEAVSAKSHAEDARISTRELGRRVGLSYEHIRKIMMGMPVVSWESNRRICLELDLDAAEMWDVAMAEKFSRRYSSPEPPERAVITIGGRMGELWGTLDDSVKEKVYNCAVVFQQQFEAERVVAEQRDRRTRKANG